MKADEVRRALDLLKNANTTRLEKALGVLYKYARNDQVPVYLRAIALHGVNRHIGRWWPTDKWPDRTKQAIERTMADIVNSEPASPLEGAPGTGVT